MEARRRALDPGVALRAGERVARHLVSAPEYRSSRRIVAYAELPGELPLSGVVERARAAGKPVLWPRLAAGGRLEFAPCERSEDLTPGRFGVREPPRATLAVALEPDDLLLVPGLAFDVRCGRLGRGGGVWDRALRATHGAIAIGVGYEFQIVDAVPYEPHDRPVDLLLTERGIRRCSEP